MKKGILHFFVIAIIFFVRIPYYIAQPDIYSDNIFQMALAQNFMDGEGFSFKYLDAQTNVHYIKDIKYPPLYPFLLAEISFITANPLLSSLIIQILVLVGLLYTWRKIFNLLNPIISEESYLYFISLFIMSASIFNVINTIIFVGLLLLSVSVYFIFKYLLSEKSKILNLILASFFSSLLFWTHYSYFLVAFYPTVVLLIIYSIYKNKTFLSRAFLSFIISLLVVSGVLIYNYLSTGIINYYTDNPNIWRTGFFPEHLLLINPFFLDAFIKSNYFVPYLMGNSHNVFINILFQLASIAIFVIITFLIIKYQKNAGDRFKKLFILLIPFFVIIILTISFLTYFSIHYKEIPSPGWTHISDMRYLSAVYLSIMAIVVILIFIKEKYLNKTTIKIFKLVLISLISINLIINIYSIIKSWNTYDYKENNYNHKEDLQDLYYNIRYVLSNGKLPVFINNGLFEDAFRMSQFAKAASINENEVIKIDKFSSDIIFFFVLYDEMNVNNKDYKLLEWGNKFNLQKIGKVRSNFDLYRISNL